MANRFLNNIRINDSYTLPDADGTQNQVIKTDGSGNLSFTDIVAEEADKALSLTLRVKNTESVALTKGQVVCAAPSATPPSGNVIEVKLADNNGTNSMPAIGILNEGLDAAGGTNDEGEAIMFGRISGIDTSAFSVGDEVFVSDTAGALTATKPTGVKYIQKVGVIMRDDATNGTIEVFGAGRTNDVPTPLYIDHANQRVGIGVEDPTYKLHVHGGGLQTTTPTGNNISYYDGTGINAYSNLGFSLSNFYQDLILRNEADDKDIIFKAAAGSASAVEIMRIDGSSGNVGIGTTSPDSKLHISGTATDNEGLLKVENTYALGGIHFPAASFINSRGNHSYGVVADFSVASSTDGDRPSILFYGGQSSTSWQIGQQTGTSWTGGLGMTNGFGIGYRASNDPNSFTTWPTAYLSMDTSGNVWSYASHRAPIFYDSNNTGYYIDPASTSNLSALNVGGSAVWTSGNDGSGSGLDADLLDGQHASYFLDTSGTAQTKSGNLTINGNLYLGDQMRVGDDAWIEDFNVANAIKIKGNQNNANGYIAFGSQNDLLGRAGTGALTWAGNTIWHAGNDGSGSGLDADTLDGQHASAFLTSYTETDTLATVTARGASTSTNVSLLGGSNVYNGHYYLNAYDSDGNHYPHFNDGANGNGVNVNWRLFQGSNLITHTWNYGDTNFVNSLRSTVDMRAPIFYDSNDTGYYLNPNSTSNLYDLQLTGAKHTYLYVNPGGGYEAMVRFNGGGGSTWYVGSRTSTQTIGSTDAWHVYSQTAGATVSGTDSAGNTFARASSRAPIFYDSDNTQFHWDPNTDNSHRFTTASGYLDIGPKNTSWCHLYTDRPGFYFNKTTFQLSGNQVFHDGYHPNADTLTTARTIAGSSFNGSANIDISYNNLTNKPTIPSGSQLVKVYNNQNYVASDPTSSGSRTDYGAGVTVYEGFSSGSDRPHTYDATVQFMPTAGQGFELSADWVSTATTPLKIRSLRDCCQGWSPWVDVAVSGTTSSGTFSTTGDYRAPIFYDSNDTNYYLNPNSTTTSAALAGRVTIGQLNTANSADNWSIKLIENSGNCYIGNHNGTAQIQAGGYLLNATGTTVQLDAGTQSYAGVWAAPNGKIHLVTAYSATYGGTPNYEIGFTMNDLGNVGIGTTSPSQKLDVVGSIEVSDGIYIGGTGVNNKLDDYEEGTYTPSITATGTDTSGFTANGYYTKIGDIVHVEMRITKFVDEGESCTVTNITLPFTANNTSTIYYKGGLWHSDTYDKSNLYVLLRENTINLTPYNGASINLSLAADESNMIGINITYKTS